MKVVQGNIAEFSKADVLVNPVLKTTTDLRRAGKVSKAFYELGREELQEEFLNKGAPQRFGTDVTKTGPGRSISCKMILHPAIGEYRNAKSLQLYTSMIKKCLQWAESHNMTSIAFPAAGCGQLGYDPSQVARCVLEAAKETKLKIYMVVYSPELCQEFKKIFATDDKSECVRTQSVKENLIALSKKSGIVCPRYWTNSTFSDVTSAKSTSYTLDKASPEYKAVTAFVMNSWQPSLVAHGRDARGLVHSKIGIKNIWTIENQLLYTNYKYKQRAFASTAAKKPFSTIAGLDGEPEIMTNLIAGVDCLKKQLVSELNEAYLFHGTNHVNEIIKGGIDSRFSGDNALFGKGAYFAESSTKSDQYTDLSERLSPDRRLYMFVARVLLGEPFLSRDRRPDLKKAPCSAKGCMKDNCSAQFHRMCDSVVGTHKNPSTRLVFREFIVYHPDQSYPEFLVEYVRI